MNAVDENTQDELRLWTEYDPNAHKMGRFDIIVEATKLLAGIRSATLPVNGNKRLVLRVHASRLFCTAGTKDSDLEVSWQIPLCEDTRIGPSAICFGVDSERLCRICSVAGSGLMRLEMRRDDRELVIYLRRLNEDHHWLNLAAEWLGTQGIESPPADSGEVTDGRALARAIDVLSPFVNDGSKTPLPSDGVFFSSGKAYAGGSAAYACYGSEDLAKSAFVVPARCAKNVRTILSRFRGLSQINVTPTHVHVFTATSVLTWRWNGPWNFDPARPLAGMNMKYLAAPSDLGPPSGLLRALFKTVSWAFLREFAGESLVIEGRLPTRRIRIRVPLISNTPSLSAADPPSPARLEIDTQHLLAAIAAGSARIALAISGHTLSLECTSDHGVTCVRLAGRSAS
jgi:hypothetical protein